MLIFTVKNLKLSKMGEHNSNGTKIVQLKIDPTAQGKSAPDHYGLSLWYNADTLAWLEIAKEIPNFLAAIRKNQINCSYYDSLRNKSNYQ